MLAGSPDANDAVAEAFEPNELVRSAQAGCVRSFTALVDHFRPRLIEMLERRYGAERSEAEDLVQETFAKAYRKLDCFDGRGQFSTWLFTIAKREAIDRHRRRSHEPRQVSLEQEAVHAAQEDPAAAMERREETENVWRRAKAILSEPQYAATWLRFAESCDVAEIARRMNRSRIGVRVLLHRARIILVKELSVDSTSTPPNQRREK
jgi:RNA polymerase sigma-70 factor (ECF subfamily)